MAIQSPLLDNISVDGATGILLNIVGGADMKMREIEEACALIHEQAHEDANIIFGASIDPSLGEMVKVTVIATGFDRAPAQEEAHSSQSQSSRMSLPSSLPSSLPLQAAPLARQVSARPAAREAESIYAQPAPSRRPPPPMGAAHPSLRESVPVVRGPESRERASYASPADQDWDIPAFVRRGQ
jgi:cell division protein FtsZ